MKFFADILHNGDNLFEGEKQLKKKKLRNFNDENSWNEIR